MAVLAVRGRLALTNIPPKFLQLRLYCMTCAWEGQNLAVNRDCNLYHCCLVLPKPSPARCMGLLGSSWGGGSTCTSHVLLHALALEGIQHSQICTRCQKSPFLVAGYLTPYNLLPSRCLVKLYRLQSSMHQVHHAPQPEKSKVSMCLHTHSSQCKSALQYSDSDL